MASRRPDYNISVLDKETGKKLPNAGGGWKNPDGSITLSLNACVVISGDKNIAIALFPASNTPPASKPAGKKAQREFGDFDEDTQEVPY